jgi:hypothetical protein
MSALGQKRTSPHVGFMSALPPKADIAERNWERKDAQVLADMIDALAAWFDDAIAPFVKDS